VNQYSADALDLPERVHSISNTEKRNGTSLKVTISSVKDLETYFPLNSSSSIIIIIIIIIITVVVFQGLGLLTFSGSELIF
jgi:hypothetical protein